MQLTISNRPDAGDFGNSRLCWGVLNAVRASLTDELETIDLSACTMLRPYSLACLAAISTASSQDVSLVLPSDGECRAHLQRFGFLEFFDTETEDVELQPAGTSVPIRQIRSGSGTFAVEAANIWANQIPNAHANYCRDLATHLDEVVLNALQHSGSSIGCIVAGQAFPKTSKVEVALVDIGVTIKDHLTQNPEHAELNEDEEAIVLATEYGVTGTIDLNALGEPNSGIGLFELRSYCEAGMGEMCIMSGEKYVVFGDEGSPRVAQIRGGFPGCLVNVRFFTD